MSLKRIHEILGQVTVTPKLPKGWTIDIPLASETELGTLVGGVDEARKMIDIRARELVQAAKAKQGVGGGNPHPGFPLAPMVPKEVPCATQYTNERVPKEKGGKTSSPPPLPASQEEERAKEKSTSTESLSSQLTASPPLPAPQDTPKTDEDRRAASESVFMPSQNRRPKTPRLGKAKESGRTTRHMRLRLPNSLCDKLLTMKPGAKEDFMASYWYAIEHQVDLQKWQASQDQIRKIGINLNAAMIVLRVSGQDGEFAKMLISMAAFAHGMSGKGDHAN